MLDMEIKCDASAAIVSASPTSSPPLPQLSPRLVLSPCAACKILRRRCGDKCVLAPYFPPTEPAKFTIAHRVFGASNIIKLLQELPESQRTDAVNSMVYEAGARIRDPIYGCAGAIYNLQRQVSELQAQLAKSQVEIVSMQLQRSNLLELIHNMDQPNQEQHNMSFDSSLEIVMSSLTALTKRALILDSLKTTSTPTPRPQCCGVILFGYDIN
ncbi:LOB domain-containing protein 1 [Raphanus sativus]|nr:LOB domain-containing protein 1 [Raphanus sativus]